MQTGEKALMPQIAMVVPGASDTDDLASKDL